METKKFDFKLVKKHLEFLTKKEEKLNYLVEQIAERKYYLVQTSKSFSGFTRYSYNLNDRFIQFCLIEKEKIEKILEPKLLLKSELKISDKKGIKTNFIRILNALYELKFIEKIDGKTLTKQEFFDSFGAFLNVDFSSYHSILSQSLQEQPIEINVRVFDDMKKITQDAHYSNQ
jgi:hypothetical protein